MSGINYANVTGQSDNPARRRWGKLSQSIRYSPYRSHQNPTKYQTDGKPKLGLGIPIKKGLSMDEWLRYHGYQTTVEFVDDATPEEYAYLKNEWREYSSYTGGYGAAPYNPLMGGNVLGTASEIGFGLAPGILRGGVRRKSKRAKSKSKSKSKSKRVKRVKRAKSKSKSKSKSKRAKRVKRAKSKSKSKSKRGKKRVNSKRK